MKSPWRSPNTDCGRTATVAFTSGRGLRWLGPGEDWQLSWGIRFEGFSAD